MKKNKKTLQLNKKAISNMHRLAIHGGSNYTIITDIFQSCPGFECLSEVCPDPTLPARFTDEPSCQCPPN
jgi:hypothetical protein